MIAVAIAGVALYASRLCERRRAIYSATAAENGLKANWQEVLVSVLTASATKQSRNATTAKRVPRIVPEAKQSVLLRDHFRHMEEKYRRAARYPWLPVAPDPPQPK
jgi:hypothetical protein